MFARLEIDDCQGNWKATFNAEKPYTHSLREMNARRERNVKS